MDSGFIWIHNKTKNGFGFTCWDSGFKVWDSLGSVNRIQSMGFNKGFKVCQDSSSVFEVCSRFKAWPRLRIQSDSQSMETGSVCKWMQSVHVELGYLSPTLWKWSHLSRHLNVPILTQLTVHSTWLYVDFLGSLTWIRVKQADGVVSRWGIPPKLHPTAGWNRVQI